MGLKTLEWHEGKNGAWVARAVFNNKKYRRVADVNARDWIGPNTQLKHRNKIPVQLMPDNIGNEITWHDSIEAAKLYVEAIFALDDY
jgi:malate synthase